MPRWLASGGTTRTLGPRSHWSVAFGRRALVVSILAHAVGLVAITRCDRGVHRVVPRGDEDRAAIPIEVLPLPLPAPVQPMEVAMVPGEVREAAAAPTARAVASQPGSSRGAAATSVEATSVEVPGDAGRELPGRPNPLAMRGLRHDLSLSGDVAARVLNDRPLPAPVKPSGRIRPSGADGKIDDLTASYTIHGDGTVEVHNKDDFDPQWRIHLPTLGRLRNTIHAIGDDLAAWRDDPYRDTRVGTWQDLPRHLQSTPGSCQRIDDPLCDANPQHGIALVDGGFILPILGGRADITGYLQRKLVGSDPYAARKMAMLDATRAERIETGAAHRAAQLGHSAESMARNLEALWRATTDPAARRQALFELWDECAEGDDPAGAAGVRARAMVIGWIGAHLPRGEPGAFSADDIAALDARRSSRQHFAPY